MRIVKSKCWHCHEVVVEIDGGKPMHTTDIGRPVEHYEWCRVSRATPQLGTYETMEC